MKCNPTMRGVKQALACLLGGALLLSTQAQAKGFLLNGSEKKDQNTSVASLYQPSAQVVPEQALITYYYPISAKVSSAPISIYVDKEFHTALLPGEFTTLCVAAGQHTLVAAVHDEPFYREKTNATAHAQFNGGTSYFIRAEPGQSLISKPVYRQDAERELSSMDRNHRLINRASSVQQCRYTGGGKDVTLIKDSVLFRFAGSSYEQLLPESKRKLERIIEFTRHSNNIGGIVLIGFTDGIGNSESNRRLSAARAETVRKALIDAGITAAIIDTQGQGIAQSANGCSKQQGDGCNKLSRRVDIMVNSQ